MMLANKTLIKEIIMTTPKSRNFKRKLIRITKQNVDDSVVGELFRAQLIRLKDELKKDLNLQNAISKDLKGHNL